MKRLVQIESRLREMQLPDSDYTEFKVWADMDDVLHGDLVFNTAAVVGVKGEEACLLQISQLPNAVFLVEGAGMGAFVVQWQEDEYVDAHLFAKALNIARDLTRGSSKPRNQFYAEALYDDLDTMEAERNG